jgi:hypothetical protein
MIGLLYCVPSKSRYDGTQTAKACQKAYNNHKYLCRQLAECAQFPGFGQFWPLCCRVGDMREAQTIKSKTRG